VPEFLQPVLCHEFVNVFEATAKGHREAAVTPFGFTSMAGQTTCKTDRNPACRVGLQKAIPRFPVFPRHP